MPDVRRQVRFILNDSDVSVGQTGPSDTLLDLLRLERKLCGTKEGCAEGDCGACTVLVGRLHEGDLLYETVNSCIRLLPSLDGCHVVTIEYLRGADDGIHPVQKALVECHGSQCGFCTPGIVMSLYALWMKHPQACEEDVKTALQGNLCRCTGYRPVIEAALSAAATADPARDILVAGRDSMIERLQRLHDGARVDVSRNSERAILPADVDDLATILTDMPEATIVAGSTDVGLWVTKSMRDISPSVFIGHLQELKSVTLDERGLTIGAAATYSECEAVLIETFPHLASYWPRIGGWQIRNMGTVGGNIANGSPIGDTPPVLISLGAEITLRRNNSRRSIPLEDFFVDYGKQDREPGEFVVSISIPRAAPDTKAAAYKISKRRDEDISSVCCGCVVVLDGGIVSSARLAYGGMSATPKRALAAEARLEGSPWTKTSIQAAVEVLESDFAPISDWRASAAYRGLVAGNLLHRFFEESTGNPEATCFTTTTGRSAG